METAERIRLLVAPLIEAVDADLYDIEFTDGVLRITVDRPGGVDMSKMPEVGAFEYLKTQAVARLYLDNVPNIKAYWIMMGLPMAQVALHFGANDVQGTLVREEIFHRAGAVTEQEQKIGELVRYVREAGRIPVQRDTLYNEIRRFDA